MQNKIRKQFVRIASVLLLALGTVTTAHAVSQPIQTQHGVVRLGSKTQANVDAKQSSVAIGEGMVLVSSKPGRLGRPVLKVSFSGAPMHAKVQGTALIAYLPGDFIQITAVEGRTYLVREGRLGEVAAIDAGKMLLVKPTAKRLPDTADINLSHFVENSPMFNGGLKLPASSLIAQAIEKQSGNRYLKSTPIYFEGAGSQAVIAGEKPELPPIGDGLGDEGQPLDSSLTGIDAIEQIPTRVAEPQLIAPQAGTPQLIAQSGGILPEPGPLLDVPGAPKLGTLILQLSNDILPSRGFLKEWLRVDPVVGNSTVFWLPATADDNALSSAGFEATGQAGLTQGVFLRPGTPSYLIFNEAKISDANTETAFKITPKLSENSNIVLKFSNDDVPSDILNRNQFRKAFRLSLSDAASSSVIVRPEVGIPQQTIPIAEFAPLDKNTNKPRLKMTIAVPPQGITIKDRFFKTDTITQPNGAIDLAAGKFPVLGLAAPTFLGSVFVDATSGSGVIVEVGDRTRTSPQGALTFELNEPGIFSLQAPPSDATVAGGAPGASSGLTIESDGPLNISDPSPGVMTGVMVVSKQGIGVQSASSELVFSKATLAAGQGIAVSSPKRIRFENSSQLAAVTAVVMQGAGTAALEVVNSAITTPDGQILIDQFDRIQVESATLMASVIKARVVSPSGVLQISNSTLAAGKLLRLYAEGSNGKVEFAGAVKLSGNKIDIAGNTVLVKKNGTVTTGPNTTVYANTRKYNKDGFGKMSEHQQGKFNARPSFSGDGRD